MKSLNHAYRFRNCYYNFYCWRQPLPLLFSVQYENELAVLKLSWIVKSIKASTEVSLQLWWNSIQNIKINRHFNCNTREWQCICENGNRNSRNKLWTQNWYLPLLSWYGELVNKQLLIYTPGRYRTTLLFIWNKSSITYILYYSNIFTS